METTPALWQTASVDLSDIDLHDTTYQIVPEHPDDQIPETLAASIKRTGILHPPIIKKKGPHLFQVVSGRKRLLAASELLNNDSCCCQILPLHLPTVKVFEVLVEDIQATRSLTLVEQALLVKKILACTDQHKTARELLQLMNLAGGPSYIQNILALLELEDPLLNSLHHGRLDEKVARELLKLAFRDRLALFEIITDLRLGTGKQKKLLTTCRELAARNKKTLADILADQELVAIFTNPTGNAPQKAAKLMAWLTQKQASQLTEAENEFRRFTQQLRLPPTASLAHSPSFEKDTISLTLSFKNRQEFSTAWQKIKPLVTKK